MYFILPFGKINGKIDKNAPIWGAFFIDMGLPLFIMVSIPYIRGAGVT